MRVFSILNSKVSRIILFVFALILLFAGTASANVVAITYHSSISVTSIFILNLPINLFFILLFHRRFNRRIRSSKYFDNTPFVSFLSLAVLITMLGVVIDTVFVTYPILRVMTEDLSMVSACASALFALALIFASFYIFPRVMLGYSHREARMLGLNMAVINFIIWSIIFYPFFAGNDIYANGDEGIFPSVVSPLVLMLIWLNFYNSKVNEMRVKKLPRQYFHDRKNLNHQFRIVIGILFGFFLILVYLSPVFNAETASKYADEFMWMNGKVIFLTITVYNLDILWIFLMLIPIISLELHKRLQRTTFSYDPEQSQRPRTY